MTDLAREHLRDFMLVAGDILLALVLIRALFDFVDDLLGGKL